MSEAQRLIDQLADQYRARFGGPDYPDFLPEGHRLPLPHGTFGKGPFGLTVTYVIDQNAGTPCVRWLETSRMGGTDLYESEIGSDWRLVGSVQEGYAIGSTDQETEANCARMVEANQRFWSQAEAWGLAENLPPAAEMARELLTDSEGDSGAAGA